MRTPAEIIAWLNRTYPGRDWDQQCARLVWNVVYYVADVTEGEMIAYDPAKDGYRASKIISTDPLAAPPGAIHYWAHPTIEGHVGVELGGGRVLMTGTPASLGTGGVTYGEGYGITTVAAYTRARGNPYLGWSRRYGANASIVGLIGTKTTPQPQPKQRDEDDMFKPTVHYRAEGNPEWTLAHPEIGRDLAPGQSQKDARVTVRLGYMITSEKALGEAWARIYSRGIGGETSSTDRAGYVAIQEAAQLTALEFNRQPRSEIMGGPVS